MTFIGFYSFFLVSGDVWPFLALLKDLLGFWLRQIQVSVNFHQFCKKDKDPLQPLSKPLETTRKH